MCKLNKIKISVIMLFFIMSVVFIYDKVGFKFYKRITINLYGTGFNNLMSNLYYDDGNGYNDKNMSKGEKSKDNGNIRFNIPGVESKGIKIEFVDGGSYVSLNRVEVEIGKSKVVYNSDKLSEILLPVKNIDNLEYKMGMLGFTSNGGSQTLEFSDNFKKNIKLEINYKKIAVVVFYFLLVFFIILIIWFFFNRVTNVVSKFVAFLDSKSNFIEPHDERELHINNVFTRHHKLFLFLYSMFFVLFAVFVLKIDFFVNDDTLLHRIIQKGYVVPFISALYGTFVSFLYKNVSQIVPWYALLLCIINVGVIYLVLRSLYVYIKNIFCFLLAAICFTLFYLPMIYSVSYTTISIMTGAAALLFFFATLKESPFMKWNVIVKVILLGFFFSFSFLLRIDGYKAVIVFSLPMICYFFFVYGRRIRIFILFFLPFTLIYVLNIFALNVTNGKNYSDYNEFNKVRGAFHSFPISEANRDNTELLKVNKWSMNDYEMLEDRMFWDEDKFNIVTLKNIFIYDNVKKKDGVFLKIKKNVCNLIVFLKKYVNFLLFITSGVIFAFLVLSKRKAFYLLSYIVYVMFGFLIFELLLRFPERVGWPIMILVNLLIIVFLFNEYLKNGKIRWYLFVIALLGLFDFFSCTIWDISSRIVAYNKIHSDVEILNKKFHGDVFIAQGGAICAEEKYVNVMQLTNYKFYLIYGGWSTFSPYFYDNIRNIGLKDGRDVIPFLIENKKAHFISNVNGIKRLTTFIEEKYGIKCTAKEIAVCGNKRVYDIERM